MNVLIITNKEDITSDFIVRQLALENIPFYRLNTDEIGGAVHLSLDFEKNKHLLFDTNLNQNFLLSEFTAVYFRRPEVKLHVSETNPAESQFLKNELFFLLEGIYKLLSHAFWLNHVDKIRIAENKIYQLLVATEIGFRIPPSLITDIQENVATFYHQNNETCIIKPIRAGLIDPGKTSK